jgi:hypothetical protein
MQPLLSLLPARRALDVSWVSAASAAFLHLNAFDTQLYQNDVIKRVSVSSVHHPSIDRMNATR